MPTLLDNRLLVPVDAGFNPKSISGLVGWWTPDLSKVWVNSTRVTPSNRSNGGLIGAMDDLSGQGNNLLQATAGARPTYQGNAAVRPVLLFDGTSQAIKATFTLNQPFTALLVAKELATATGILMSSPVVNVQIARSFTGDFYSVFAGSQVTSSSTWGTSAFRVLCTTLASSTVSQWSDGIQVLAGAAGAGNPGGVNLGSGNGTNFANMLLGECLVYNRVLSTSELGRLTTQWLNPRWQLSAAAPT